MSAEILTVAEMYAADRYAAEHGVATLALMEAAGEAVAEAVHRRWPGAAVAVLCGPGNNGGDGFVAARHLEAQGHEVEIALLGPREALKGDAAVMAERWDGLIAPLSPAILRGADVVVDALFGAGLSRPLDGVAEECVTALNRSGLPVVAVDVPSGLHGDAARPLSGGCVEADVTVTFFRKKPAHVLMPGRMLCGDVTVADIGIPAAALETIRPRMIENTPDYWGEGYPWPEAMGHKYARGHAVAVSGPAHATGAARLAAMAALRVGAGLVSVASPMDAVTVNAAALTAIMVKPFAGAGGLEDLLKDKRFNAVAIGPGSGVGELTRAMVLAVLKSGAAAVLDADALTSFADRPSELFALLHERMVLTPHAGEFDRLFPGLLKSGMRVAVAREAAKAAGCTLLLKGPDTVIAAPDGFVAVNTNAPPALATAGAGDVLTGLIAGLLAQGMGAHQAASAAAWLHGEAANLFGPGLIAEDLPELLPAALSALKDCL
ncbi:MAG: NAD(P)H-hydrate dehydratase [Alphaproteobacteria bacterium]|nr:NAD(P)H-hydrate dehydratase [Alphaproteobacteria bacterium]MDE2011391.1 NAD(P)H-hydrate dehydratase [Alphaproteobacteria bacterium]MDE2073464.1 NAD(P)H-hydrate dehydratase [Alphaproteobacteria bacterium]MDE2352653.1 NAD(P)H-hydrate dehydratase [Alphaproteobacteria bacterium]